MDTPLLLTVEQAARAVQVSTGTIRRMIRRGKLPALNYGSGTRDIYRVKPEDLFTVQPIQPPAPRESRRRRRVLPVTPTGNVWPPPISGSLNRDDDNRSSSGAPKKKRGRPAVLTDEQRAAKQQAKQEKFREFLKNRDEAAGPLRDLGE